MDARFVTVLVVDDETAVRDLLGETLTAVGYRALLADSYDAAIGLLRRESVDLVVCDILLPGRSGMDLIGHVKREFPHIPVLAISGKEVSENQVLQAGADGFLAKPFRIGKIEALIETTLARYDSAKTKPGLPRKKILIVDDEENIRKTLIESLDVLGYEAVGVSDGQEALDLLSWQDFDAVITDIRMPRMNGIELLHAIKAKSPDLPVILITGYPLAYPEKQAMQHGASGYIPKPFRINQIDRLLASVLYRYEPRES